MNVSAKEESQGVSKQIVIKNEKGRLSEEEIQNMIKKAEEMKKEDDAQVAKVNSKNQLEAYLFGVKNTFTDKNLEGKIQPEEKNKALTIIDDSIKWIGHTQNASKEDYEKKQKEVEEVVMPILQRLQGGMPQQHQEPSPETDSKGAKFDNLEVD